MTFEQAQLLIKLFILQHYDEDIEYVIPNVKYHGKVSNLVNDGTGDWFFNGFGFAFICWKTDGKYQNKTTNDNDWSVIITKNGNSSTNIIDFINTNEEL